MLRSCNQILGYAIHATDGDIGSLHDLYFDDQSTAIRYLVVDTGQLAARPSRPSSAPAAIGGVDADREGVRHRARPASRSRTVPTIVTDQPVSRQQELALHTYYGWDPVLDRAAARRHARRPTGAR